MYRTKKNKILLDIVRSVVNVYEEQVKYCDEFARQAYHMSCKGLTNAEMAKIFGVSVRTFYNWAATQPVFAVALQEGKAIIDARVEKSCLDMALGYTRKEYKRSCFKGQWSDSVEVEVYYPAVPSMVAFWLSHRQPAKWGPLKPDSKNLSPAQQIAVDVSSFTDDEIADMLHEAAKQLGNEPNTER